MNKIDIVIRDWSKRKVLNGKSVDELFQIDGVPLRWFYRRFFIESVMPQHVNTLKFMRKNKKLSISDKIKFFLGARILRKYIYFNEKRKINYMRKIDGYDKKKKKILFLTYTNHLSDDGKIFRIQKLIDTIKKDKKLKEFVLFADPLSQKSYKKISKLNNIYKYYDEKMSKKAKRLSNEFFKRWESINQKTKYKMFKIGKTSLWPYLKYPLDFYFSKEFFYFLFLYYEIFKKILLNENVKCVVVTAKNSLFEKCLLLAAKETKTQSILIHHGSTTLGDSEIGLDYPIKNVVFSDFDKEKLMKKGIKQKDLHVVGSIIFDATVKYKKKKKSTSKTILLATDSTIETNFVKKDAYFKRIEKILKEINDISSVKIVIKLHPREIHIKEYEKIIKNKGYDNVKIYSGNIAREQFYSLISNSDCFVSFGSTAAIEAMIIDRPIVTIDITGDHRLSRWIEKENLTVNIGYKDNLKKAIERALKKENSFRIKRKKFIQKYYGRIDGKASERIAKLIKDII